MDDLLHHAIVRHHPVVEVTEIRTVVVVMTIDIANVVIQEVDRVVRDTDVDVVQVHDHDLDRRHHEIAVINVRKDQDVMMIVVDVDRIQTLVHLIKRMANIFPVVRVMNVNKLQHPMAIIIIVPKLKSMEKTNPVLSILE